MPSLDTTLGSMQLGGVIATFFFGIVSMQVYNYSRDYPRDSAVLKSVVILTWVFELVHTILIWHSIYSLTVTFYGKPAHITAPPRTFYLAVLFATSITTTVQIFFAKRIQIFSKQWLVPVITWILAGLSSGGIVGLVVILCVHNTLEILKTYRWLASTILVLTALVDVIIAVFMCYCLWRVRSTEFQTTTTIIDTLITWCIESTVVKSGASILTLILFLTRPDDLLWIIFFLPKASLFSNSMLASLNGRNRLASTADEPSGGPRFISFNSANTTPGSPTVGRNKNVVIQMTRMTETHIDDGNEESVAESKECN